ncbi:MAG: HAD domain-containing protein [Xanthobacteraceae bacterium]
MKVIFLDIDGVLNCTTTPNPRKFPYIVDPNLCAKLRTLVGATGAEVVLSSTWRYDPVGLLAAKHFGIPFIGVLPDLPGQPRSVEVREWLHRHPDVERFVVIDDDDDELDNFPLFQPSAKTGLTDGIVQGAAAYLNGLTKRDMRCTPVKRAWQNLCAALKGHKG